MPLQLIVTELKICKTYVILSLHTGKRCSCSRVMLMKQDCSRILVHPSCNPWVLVHSSCLSSRILVHQAGYLFTHRVHQAEYLFTRRVHQAGLLAGACEPVPASAPRTHLRRSTAVYRSRTAVSPCRSSLRTPIGSPASQRGCRKMQRSTQGRRCLLAADDPMDRIPTHYSQKYRLTYIHED